MDPEQQKQQVAPMDSLPPLAAPPTNSMTEEEKQRILSSDDYSRFIERASLVMERSLADTTDILFDLSGGKEEQNDE